MMKPLWKKGRIRPQVTPVLPGFQYRHSWLGLRLADAMAKRKAVFIDSHFNPALQRPDQKLQTSWFRVPDSTPPSCERWSSLTGRHHGSPSSNLCKIGNHTLPAIWGILVTRSEE